MVLWSAVCFVYYVDAKDTVVDGVLFSLLLMLVFRVYSCLLFFALASALVVLCFRS